MRESEWAKRMAQEFKAGKARKAEEDAKLQEEQTARKESASKLWTEVRGAFKAKAQMFNAELGEEILTWAAGDANTFILGRKDVEGCVKGSYLEDGYEIIVEVLGRVVPFEVVFEHHTGKYCLLGAGGEPSEPDGLAETLIGEFLGKY